MARLIPTASQTVGPFFGFALTHPEWSDLTKAGAQGERIRIAGRVLDGDGAAVPDALLEIWQANAAGRYDHPEDSQAKPTDRHFHGFGRAATDKDGKFEFVTVKPGRVPGRGNALQAPHIAVTVFARGLLKHLVTRIYFEGEPANDSDPVLAKVEDPERRRTLLARPDGPGAWRFDVVLQGPHETVFFDI
jgi:protocatechuate 3,4-dioxygenase alpha subunit